MRLNRPDPASPSARAEAGELDPTSLLAIDSEQQEQELPDIQIPSHAEMSIQLGKPVANQLNSDLSQTIRATAANFAAEVGNKLPQTSPVPANASGKQLERQLSESRISPPAQSPENSKSNELRQIIEQIRSVKFETSRGLTCRGRTTTAGPAARRYLAGCYAPANHHRPPCRNRTATSRFVHCDPAGRRINQRPYTPDSRGAAQRPQSNYQPLRACRDFVPKRQDGAGGTVL